MYTFNRLTLFDNLATISLLANAFFAGAALSVRLQRLIRSVASAGDGWNPRGRLPAFISGRAQNRAKLEVNTTSFARHRVCRILAGKSFRKCPHANSTILHGWIGFPANDARL
jgi:hypothetical protein